MQNLTSPKKIAWLFSSVMLMAHLSANAEESQSPDGPNIDLCSTDLSGKSSVTVNSNNGKILSTRTDFPSHPAVDVVFVFENPFRYSYGYEFEREELQEIDLSNALSSIGLLSNQDDGEGDGNADTADGTEMLIAANAGIELSSAGAGAKASCTALDEESEFASRIVSLKQELSGEIARANVLFEKFDEGWKALQEVEVSNVGQCEVLAKSGRTLLSNNRELFEGKITEDWTDLNNRVRLLDETIETYQKTLPQKCVTERFDALKLGTQSKELSRKSSTTYVEFKNKMKMARSVYTRVEGTLSSPDGFRKTHPIGPVRRATDFTATITKTLIADPKESASIEVESIRLGHRIFSYSIGAAVGFRTEREFERQASLSGMSDDGGDKLMNVVGIAESSNSQIGVVGQVNARLGSVVRKHPRVGYGVSFGGSITDSEDDAFGLFAGAHLSYKNQVFLTAAYHLQTTSRLGGEFEVGDLVPDELDGEIPTTSRNRGSLLVTLTYRMN